jgi:hypothetical protein
MDYRLLKTSGFVKMMKKIQQKIHRLFERQTGSKAAQFRMVDLIFIAQRQPDKPSILFAVPSKIIIRAKL